MRDITRWLDEHGLGKYADLFVENEIEIGVLRQLEETDLKELEIPLGARKKILKAISELDAEELPESSAVSPRSTASGDAERRQLTVMFCDLVGSTALSATMDTEDYRDLLGTYQSAASRAIQDNDGYIARYMGDGLLVYFGYPVAQENDPERAARAGLAVVDAVAALEGPVALEVRIGIATGTVVVGDIVGEGASEEAAVLGETPNLAARLQGAAAPNTVLLSPTTHQLLRGRMETEALGPVELKGLSRPVTPYRVVQARSLSEISETEFNSTPLIGREVELALVQRAWRNATMSEGQAVLISGEPGVGKSRLLRAFREGLEEPSHTRVQWHCSPYYQTTANYPAVEQLKRGLKGHTLKSLEALVCDLGLDVDISVPLLALLLSVPLDDRYVAVQWAPDELKRRLIQVQVELLIAAARQAPVLLVVEDLHWADPSTLEVLGEMIAATRYEQVLVLMTARPEFRPTWTAQPHAITQQLASLSRHDTTVLVQSIVEERGLPPEVIEQIVERTDGVPLYVEELARVVLDSDASRAIPATLRDALTARLDSLKEAKEVAQAASVLGRVFRSELLSHISGLSEGQVESGLSALLESGLARRISASPSGDFQFKHALIRDAAYDSLLRSSSEAMHRRTAEALSEHRYAAGPEVIARHFEEAGDLERAGILWGAAGEEARQRGANEESELHFRRALRLAEENEADPSRRLQSALRLAHMMHLNGRRSEAERLLVSQEKLVQEVADSGMVGWYYCTHGEVCSFLGKRKNARKSFHKAIAAANEGGDRQLVGTARVGLAVEHFFMEEYREALAHHEAAASLLLSEGNLNWEAAGALSRALVGVAYASVNLGEMAKARASLAQFEQVGDELTHGGTEPPSFIVAIVALAAGEWDVAISYVEKELERDHAPFHKAILQYWRSNAYLGRGDVDRAVPMLEEAFEQAKRYRSSQVQLWAALALGDAYRVAARWQEAEQFAADCQARAEAIGVPDTGVALLLGEIALDRGKLKEARGALESALRGFESREMRPAEGRTRLRLATLEHRETNAKEARRHLVAAKAIYRAMEADWFIQQTHETSKSLQIDLASGV